MPVYPIKTKNSAKDCGILCCTMFSALPCRDD
jgi:hypothetical protein